MVKLVVRIVAFFLIFGLILSWLKSCEGSPLDRWLSKLLDPTEDSGRFSDNITNEDIRNADPTEFNIYVNIAISKLNEQYISCNSTNINISQEINPIYVQIDQYNQTINNQTNYIKNSNINQVSLIEWAENNRTSISLLNDKYNNLNNKIDGLNSELKDLNSKIKSLRNDIESNRKHFSDYIRKLEDKYKKQGIEISKITEIIKSETEKYNKLQNELKELIEKLTSKVKSLTQELNATKAKLEDLDKSIKKCIKKLEELNKKIDELIKKSGRDPINDDTNYYYIIDTEEKLKAKGIVFSDGLSDELHVVSEPDKSYFALLTDKNKTIKLGKEKDSFEVLSDMPAHSYEFRSINNMKVLTITDLKGFWSKTKYLVIMKE